MNLICRERDHGRYYRQARVPKLSLLKLLSDDPEGQEEFEESEPNQDDDQIVISQASLQEDETFEEADESEKSMARKCYEIAVKKLEIGKYIAILQSYWPDFDKMLSTNNGSTRGGYLPALLNYDLVVFSLCVLTLFVFMLIRPYSIFFGRTFELSWMLRADIVMLKTLYGLLSFPFLIFVSPLAPILLHMRPTAYNKKGECVPVNIVHKYTDAYRTTKKTSKPKVE